MFRYYLTQRPPMPGTVPPNPKIVEDFGERKEIPELGRPAWGYVEYDIPLTDEQVTGYELSEVTSNA